MYLTVANILEYDKSHGSSLSENFINGENLLRGRMLPHCGRMNDNFQGYKLIAYCEKDEHRDKRPYEIRGVINLKGKILRMTCNCEDGLDGQCKHIFASLLYCASHDLDDLHKASDKEIEDMQTADFTPRPLCEYEWFKKMVREAKIRNDLTAEEEEEDDESVRNRTTEDVDEMFKDRLNQILYRTNFETVVVKEEPKSF